MKDRLVPVLLLPHSWVNERCIRLSPSWINWAWCIQPVSWCLSHWPWVCLSFAPKTQLMRQSNIWNLNIVCDSGMISEWPSLGLGSFWCLVVSRPLCVLCFLSLILSKCWDPFSSLLFMFIFLYLWVGRDTLSELIHPVLPYKDWFPREQNKGRHQNVII